MVEAAATAGGGHETEKGLLVMAYGTARDLDDVERFYTDIRRGSPPPSGLLAELKDRYRAIGGRSRLYAITEAQARGIEARLTGARVYVGQKHSPPFIADGVARAVSDGVTRLAGLVLAPHYSSLSVGDYESRARQASEMLGWRGDWVMVRSWHDEPGYVSWLARAVEDALAGMPGRTTVVFTAHSLPERILATGDPYRDQLRETALAVASAAGLERVTVAWQSAGRTGDSWLGPDVLEVIDELASSGEKGIVLCPCGFVADHLEVLYDIDIEAAGRARERDLAFARTASPNDDPAFLDALSAVAARALGE